MILAAVAACVAFIVYAGTRIYGTIGPSRAAVGADGNLVLASHGRLHVFGPDGMRRANIDLAAIGAPRRPPDFELHRDGRAVFTDPDTPELVRCTLPQGPCERIPVAIASAPAQEVLPMNAAKLHVDDDAGRYYISDNAGFRVIAVAFDGRLISATTADIVRHPNQLARVGADRLAVVDTDHSRIAVFEVSEQGIGKLVASQSTNSPAARRGRRWPFDAQPLPDGGMAVLVAAAGMKDADLVLFDGKGAPAGRADLGAESDPFDVVLWRGRLWVADATRYRFDAVNLDGSPAPALEDAAFLAELALERDAPDQWKTYRMFAQFALVGIPLLGALLLRTLGEEPVPSAPSKTAAAARGPAIRSDGIEWLTPTPRYMARVRWGMHAFAWLSLVVVVAWIALSMTASKQAVFSWSGVRTYLPYFAGMLLMIALTFVTYRTVPDRLTRIRLGSSAASLRFEVPESGFTARAKTGEAPWEQVSYDQQRLLVGAQLVIVAAPLWGPTFDPAEFKRLVVDRIPPVNIVSRAQLGIRAMRAAKLRSALVIALIAIGIAIYVVLRFRLL